MLTEIRRSLQDLATAAKLLNGKLGGLDAAVVPPLDQAKALIELTKLQARLDKIAAGLSGFLPFADGGATA